MEKYSIVNWKNKPRKKCTCTGRDQKIEPDLYFKIKEENHILTKAI